VLLRLGLVAGDAAALELAERYLAQRAAGTAGVSAWAQSALLAALDLYLNAQVLVVTEGTGKAELVTAAHRVFAPTLCLAGAWAAPSTLEGKTSDGARARAFVCRGPTCSPPVTEPSGLSSLLRPDA